MDCVEKHFSLIRPEPAHDIKSPTRPTFALPQGLAKHDSLKHVACDFASSLCNGLFPKLGRELLQPAGAASALIQP